MSKLPDRPIEPVNPMKAITVLVTAWAVDFALEFFMLVRQAMGVAAKNLEDAGRSAATESILARSFY